MRSRNVAGGVLVIGSANVDLTMGLERLPERGETVSGGVFLQAMGGKGANQAVAARRNGASVTLVTCVGADAYGEAVLAAMRAEGVDVAGAVVSEAAPTGVALIQYDGAGNNTIAVAPGANFALEPEMVAGTLSRLGEFGLLVLQNELAPATLEVILREAGRCQTPVLLNVAPVQGVSLEALLGEHVGLVVNETEAASLLGRAVGDAAEALAAAEELRVRGLRFAVVTLGAQGCCVAMEGSAFHQPAMVVKAVDATAAGDTFCGALAAELVRCERMTDEAMRQAVRFATAAAGLATTVVGAQSSIPRRAAVEAALREGTCR